jgi:NAD(P)-dependent dehydrogenase (short-subunit alcohol dehydrogenase family)
MQSIFTVNRTALVTGASAGIGLEVTKALAPKLDSLIVVARRVERLELVAKEPVFQRLRLRSWGQIFPILKRFKGFCGSWKPSVYM